MAGLVYVVVTYYSTLIIYIIYMHAGVLTYVSADCVEAR
jgi:hypothetical protein